MSTCPKTMEPNWNVEDIIADKVDTTQEIACNVVTMLDEGATIPFIARYRKEKTGGMEADKLRTINTTLEELRTVQAKMKTVFNSIESQGKMNKSLASALSNSRSLNEIEHLYAPYKPGHKGSLAERARKLGLEAPAIDILKGNAISLNSFLKPSEKGLENVHNIEKGVQNIIADIVSKDKDVIEEVRKMSAWATLESCRNKADSKDTSNVKAKDSVKVKDVGVFKRDDSHKFEQYFDFSNPVKYIKSHQVLAINRGEDKKILTVKVTISDQSKSRLLGFCTRLYIKHWWVEQQRSIIEQSITDAYDRLIFPQMCRHVRSELTKTAEKESIDVFATNLHSLLLIPPVRAKTVLGIDPGFRNGCKMAVVSSTGVIQMTHVLYFLVNKKNDYEKMKLIDLVNEHRCDVIAIGNGCACRQTEEFVAGIIKEKKFWHQDVMYCIVDESGASIYSVSEEAQREMPSLDATLRGAVSIARRLQDPLAELVKIEPKHIGVGMYQHDIAENKLKTSLDSVVEECVSFVGVDINTGSECLLRRIAGLNAKKAKSIIEWRDKHGAFRNREQLLGIKGLGQKGYEQCAGFIRVVHDFSEDSLRNQIQEVSVEAEAPVKGRKRKAGASKVPAKRKKANHSDTPNPLDMTAIHPESYHITQRLMSEVGVDSVDIGKDSFCESVIGFIKKTSTQDLAAKYDTDLHTMDLIIQALQRTLLCDFRDKYDKPLFKKGVLSMEELKVRQKLTGRVQNVTHFGAFVDIGVGQSGLIHSSQMRQGLEGRKGVELGDNVNVEVMNIDLGKKRIGLKLLGFTKR